MSMKRQSKVAQAHECVICAVRTVNCRAIECNHEFCYRCLSKWGRRKGNCPLCRIDIRQIYYKNKVISPKYLLEFDQIYAESQISLEVIQRLPVSRNHAIPMVPMQYYYHNPFAYLLAISYNINSQ